MEQKKILIVDDDSRLLSLLARYLSDQGYSVACVSDGLEMSKKIERDYFDLIVLDWMMPGEDGLSICRRLSKNENHPPIIMLTANGDKDACILSLESGADDYLPKPCNLRELSARIQAVLRRSKRVPATNPTGNLLPLCFGPFQINLLERCIYRDEDMVNLTANEFALIKVLAINAGIPLSRERLSYLIDGRNRGPESRTLDIQVSRLRQLLEDDPSRPRYLQTVRGVGYVLILEASTT